MWVGRNAATKEAKIYLRLYLSVWENPHPDKTVASLDYVSAMTVAAPFRGNHCGNTFAGPSWPGAALGD